MAKKKPQKNNPSILLIDGDVLLYRFGHRGQESADWDGDGEKHTWTINEDMTIHEMHDFIKWLKEKTGCTKVWICLSGSSSDIFRYKILSTYKHNRKDKEKPELFKVLREELIEQYTIAQKPNLEADDGLGIISTSMPGKCIVCTIDKDLQQIPGMFFNFDKDEEPREISKEDADLFFYKQILTGDPTDGFSGAPGIGTKTADKIINGVYGELAHPSEADIWKAIVETYERKGQTEEYALTMARMARILRVEDWDIERQEPIYWEPEGGLIRDS